jgi:hypothetical protein
LCVTSGQVTPGERNCFVTRSPVVRAVVPGTLGSAVELGFTYRGPSEKDVPLASGELRRQIGLKLRAQDTCNVVYVMWHIAPTSGIHVSVKSNPGQRSHHECGDRGYINLTPMRSRRLNPLQAGERHVLFASINGTLLSVTVDGAMAWEGTLPSAAFAFDGPVGFRADNGELEAELRAIITNEASCPPVD